MTDHDDDKVKDEAIAALRGIIGALKRRVLYGTTTISASAKQSAASAALSVVLRRGETELSDLPDDLLQDLVNLGALSANYQRAEQASDESTPTDHLIDKGEESDGVAGPRDIHWPNGVEPVRATVRNELETSPPRYAELLLQLLPRNHRESFVGDHEEEYQDDVREHDKRCADRRYFREVVQEVCPLILRWVERALTLYLKLRGL